MKNFKFLSIVTFLSLTGSLFFMTGCIDEQHPGNYYTYQGQTIASELEKRTEDFSEFIKVLKRAGIWTELSTYGEHTLFVPYNASVQEFVKERQAKRRVWDKDSTIVYNSVDDLPQVDCDTLARTHLIDLTCYVGDMKEGSFPQPNQNDKYLMLTFDSIFNYVNPNGKDTVYKLMRRINKFSNIVEKDDSCDNGVIHTIDKCIDFTGNYVYDLIDDNPETSIFSMALKECGLSGPHNLLSQYYDVDYHMGEDSVGPNSVVRLERVGSISYVVSYWEKKKTCFTVFAVTNSVFERCCNVHNFDELVAYAKKVYDKEYPEDSHITDFKDRKNSLNRFISYHILPFAADRSKFNTDPNIVGTYNSQSGKIKDKRMTELNKDLQKKHPYDPEDYFETCAPHTLMRISSIIAQSEKSYDDVFINRMDIEGNGTKEYEGSTYRGVRIIPFSESGDIKQIADNGYVYYIDSVLLYDYTTRNKILNRRIRIDCSTLSPDFITSGARQKYMGENVSGDRPGFGFRDPTNWKAINSNFKMSVRPVNNSDSYAYEGDGIDIQGFFDISIKLPPVPHDGTWQIRLSVRTNKHCGIVQSYLAEVQSGKEPEMGDWDPLGIPTDLRFDNLKGSQIGWKDDPDEEEDINALDKTMKNHSWLKGPESQATSGKDPHREKETMGRRILTTGLMYSNMDYYLRIKQVLQGSDDVEFLFDYMEFVPKEVYDYDEDRN